MALMVLLTDQTRERTSEPEEMSIETSKMKIQIKKT